VAGRAGKSPAKSEPFTATGAVSSYFSAPTEHAILMSCPGDKDQDRDTDIPLSRTRSHLALLAGWMDGWDHPVTQKYSCELVNC